jgi:hypothetical protein
VMQPVGIAKGRSARLGASPGGGGLGRPGGWAGRRAKGGREREATHGFRGSVRLMTETDQVPT